MSGRITITLGDGSTVDSQPQTIQAFLRSRSQGSTAVAAFVNNTYSSLLTELTHDCHLVPIDAASNSGATVLRRTLCFLCAQALHQLWPNHQFRLGHSIGDGYFYSSNSMEFTADNCRQLADALNAIIAQDSPIQPQIVPWAQVVAELRATNRETTADLLLQHNPSTIRVFRSGNWFDIERGPLGPSTRFVPEWSIQAFTQGFVLTHAGESTPDILQPFRRSPLLFSVYQEYKEWGEVLGISTLSQLNRLGIRKDFREFIWVAEALHQKKIAEIAGRFYEGHEHLKIVLIAGPSSSGKTTFSKRLAIQLRALGLQPVTISLDNYFVDRDATPKDEDGKYDFECIRALDLDFLNHQLVELLAGKTIELPTFDFKSGTRVTSGQFLTLPADGVVVMEGIHGLNNELTAAIAPETKFRVYVSALTQLSIDNYNRIPTTDNRLLRRLVRDYRYRGHSAANTLSMWPSVRRGENRNIFPYQDSADAVFNSALDFELGVLKSYAEPLLRGVQPDNEHYAEARRLLSFLDQFWAIPADIVPDQSILREFIGGSAFKY